MSENVKFIVTEVNKLLGKNYNFFGFNALGPEDLLQVLCDVLTKIQGDDVPRIDVRTESPEQSSVYILTALRVLYYQPKTDPASFRQGLVRGDPETIYPILTWLLTHIDMVRKRAYLSRFLVKVEVPSDYLADPDISTLYEQYVALVDRFKSVHKEREIGKKNIEATAELAADVQAMEKEKEAVTVRIEKLKSKTKAALHLLNASRFLRTEKDKERDLIMQKDEEARTLSALQMSLQRLEREIESLRRDGSNVTAETLIQRLTEEVTVHTAVVKEKLPSELNAKKNRTKALMSVRGYSYLGPEEIGALRNKLDGIAKDIQDLVEMKISKSDADKMEPFRQQATAVRNMKRAVLEKLEKTENTLKELEAKLEEKREESKILIEEIAPKGEEMKRYIAHLKNKSILYKRCKTELTGLKAENGVLRRTTVILEGQIARSRANGKEKTLSRSTKSIPDDYTAENAYSQNVQLARTISSFRAQLVPLLSEVQKLRRKSQELDERYEQASKSHEALESTVKNSIANLSLEINRLREQLDKDTEEKETLKRAIERMEHLETRIEEEMKKPTHSGHGRALKEELNTAIAQEEERTKTLSTQKEEAEKSVSQNEKQILFWNNVASIFTRKIRCAEDNKETNGIVVRRGDAETLVLS